MTFRRLLVAIIKGRFKSFISGKEVQREAGMLDLGDVTNQRKETKLKHTKGLYLGKSVSLVDIATHIFLDSWTPKLVKNVTPRQDDPAKRRVITFIFL